MQYNICDFFIVSVGDGGEKEMENHNKLLYSTFLPPIIRLEKYFCSTLHFAASVYSIMDACISSAQMHVAIMLLPSLSSFLFYFFTGIKY